MPQEQRRRGRPKAFNGPQTQNTIQALDRALDVLNALATPEGKTLSELAGELGQSAATMHRVLATLERREFVEISPDRQIWHIGPEAYRLGAAFLRRSNVVERSRPIMRELMLETGETSNLGIEKDGNVLFISQVETHESIRAFFPPGTLSPMHASGIGKALLSTFDEDRLAGLFHKKTFERFTEKTVQSFEQLREELQNTRDRGYSFDDEERTKGMRCVASPILNVHGEAVAGISVSGPKHRLQDGGIAQLGERVKNAARMVSRRLGAP
ncbi:IclR family transcriptional regulator [Rhizobium sp. P38BS-XIX]|uniref:HTH-type transcriptional regulator BhcR n=1 Tax=Rhizobium sp. P38BS-XIX TaxID=2726740 RepID=UPI00145650F7|nr:HTH-type transcriptional regulator BhcR [Rhizobium sp. P38BS-XIX]NLR97544.1 IclR family transcriptional regulator [Rhizobium sp. P38BS-XIX]